MSFCTIVDHPILKSKLSELRQKSTSSHSFRSIMSEISSLMAYEATRELELIKKNIETPLTTMSADKLKDELIIISILRAGMGMIDGILRILPFAHVGHIGIYRDKFINNTVEYYFKVPECENRSVFLCDPLIATGDTMIAAINRLKEYKVGQINILGILSCPKALEKINERHPDVKIWLISKDEELTEKGYLTPGIGDVGDRLYGLL